MSDQEQDVCSIHQQPCIAVDLSPSVELEQKFLCINCVAPQFANHKILKSQFKEKMTDFKQKEYKNKKQLYERKLENYQQFCAKLQGYLDYINGSLNKILVQINQQIEKIKNQISNISQPKDQILKEDLMLYIQSLPQETNENKELHSTCNQESECDFLKLILEQFQKIQFKDQYKEIIKQIQQIMSQKAVSMEQIKLLQPKNDKDDKSQKTPSLDYLCNCHGKELIICTLDSDYQDERLFCIDCLPDTSVKLTTLKETNNQWLIHQDKVYNSNNVFLNQREQRYSNILEIITSYQQSNKQLQHELIQLLYNQNEIVQNDILNLLQTKNKQSLMQLDIKKVKAAINVLSQKGQLTQALEFQQQLKLKDQQYEKELLNKLKEIEQIEINCKKNLQQLLNQNEFLELDIQINQYNIESQQKQLDSRIFMVLIPQLQEIFTVFKEILKQTIVKGQYYMDYLKKLETNSNDQLQQEKQNLQKYQSLQTKLENQFLLLVGNKDQQDKSCQTSLDLNINSQIIKFIPQTLKQGKIQVNQSNQAIQNLCVSNKIFAVTVKAIKLFQFSASQIKDIQFTYPIYTKFNQPLKFSTTLKHSNITISADGKTAQSTSGGWQLCLCDQPIPKNGTVVVDFKVKQIQYIMAGICLKDSYNKDYTNSHGNGKGCYFLYTNSSNQSYVYSHHDPNKQGQQQGFPFQQNDIISMEVNVQSKQISWRNKAKNHVYSMDIQTTSDLYFCFNLYQSNEIELV